MFRYFGRIERWDKVNFSSGWNFYRPDNVEWSEVHMLRIWSMNHKQFDYARRLNIFLLMNKHVRRWIKFNNPWQKYSYLNMFWSIMSLPSDPICGEKCKGERNCLCMSVAPIPPPHSPHTHTRHAILVWNLKGRVDHPGTNNNISTSIFVDEVQCEHLYPRGLTTSATPHAINRYCTRQLFHRYHQTISPTAYHGRSGHSCHGCLDRPSCNLMSTDPKVLFCVFCLSYSLFI